MLLRRPDFVERRPLELADVPRPAPGVRRVLVRVLCCGVCHTDLHTVEGEILPSRMPVIPGHQVIGIVEEVGEGASKLRVGQRVGLAWLGRTCGTCEYCRRGDENLCSSALFTGFDLDGGYAEYAVAHESFVYPVPEGIADEQAAPLMCAGIIGYHALRRAEIRPGSRVGLYGFGASAHVAIQILNHWGCETYVLSRSASHRALAEKLGASWTGATGEDPPKSIESGVIFAPAGDIVPEALRALSRGGTLALAGIYMSPIPELDYETTLFYEKTLRSVTASTRRDGVELLKLAREIPIRTETVMSPLEAANDVLMALKNGAIDGAAVLRVSEE
jgi:alcohol dehydrogenase, propanol-preferring